MAKIGKRKYPAVYTKEGKWFTGWEEDAREGEVPQDYQGNSYWENRYGFIKDTSHVSRVLELQYAGYGRGRSSAVIILSDREGYEYRMSLSGYDDLMKVLNWSRPQLRAAGYASFDAGDKFDISGFRDMSQGGTWIKGTFCQTKQGANYFIEACEV